MKSRRDARKKRLVGVNRMLVSVVLSSAIAVACGGGEDADGDSDSHETGGSSHADGGSTSTPDYCDVAPIIESKCLRCHGEPQENGAPFPLTTYEMLVAESPEGSGKPLYERMEEAITSDYMPATWMELEPPVEDLTEHEETTLLDWFHAGAPRGHVPCD